MAESRHAARLALPIDNPTFCQIIRRQLDANAIAWDDADEVFAHPAGHVREHIMAAFDFNTKSRVGEGLHHNTLDFQCWFLFLLIRHFEFLPWMIAAAKRHDSRGLCAPTVPLTLQS
jgi:hypothetical protein